MIRLSREFIYSKCSDVVNVPFPTRLHIAQNLINQNELPQLQYSQKTLLNDQLQIPYHIAPLINLSYRGSLPIET